VRLVLLVLLAASSLVWAQARPGADAKPPAKAEDKAPADPEQAKKKPRRPRVIFKKDGSVGDDASGGGERSGSSSMGGTPGTPSGSFTR
jgi:hypothetical protein